MHFRARCPVSDHHGKNEVGAVVDALFRFGLTQAECHHRILTTVKQPAQRRYH